MGFFVASVELGTVEAQLIPVAIYPGIAKFLDPTNEFAATGTYIQEPIDKTDAQSCSIDFKFYFSHGNFRTEVDMTECKNSKFPVPEEIKINWRTNGVAEFITIYNRTDGEVWQFHPTHKGSFGRALTEAEAKQFRVWPTNSQTAVGSETIGGACLHEISRLLREGN